MTELEVAEIKAMCLDLANRYCILSDDVDGAGVAALFTPDCHYLRDDVVVNGRAEMAAQASDRPAGLITRHVLTTAVIDVDTPDRARGRLYALTYVSGGGFTPDRPIFRENQDEYRLTDEGWKIHSRIVLTPFGVR